MKRHYPPFLFKYTPYTLKQPETVRYLVCLFTLALTLLVLPMSYSQENGGVIHGKLIDAKIGEPIANHKVILNTHRAGDVSQQETTTDADGHFHFEDLQIDMQTHYSITTTYNDIEHEEKDLVLSSFVPKLVVDINIGAVTDDLSQIRIKTYSIALGFASEDHIRDGILSIFEVFVVENSGALPFQTTLNDEQVGFYFALPKEHENLRPLSPPSLTINPTEDHVILTNPLSTGETEGGFGYTIHAKGREIKLSRQMPFQTDQITFLIPEGISIVPRSKMFIQDGRTQFHGVVYTKYVAALQGGFPIGNTPDLSLTISKSQVSGQKSDIGQMVLIAVASALAGGFLVAAIFTLRKAKQGEPTSDTDTTDTPAMDTGWLRKLSDTDLENARTTRLEFITMLDALHEKKDISERVYNRYRKEQTDLLTEILDQRKERGLGN